MCPSIANPATPKTFVIDVDGVMTTGQFLYSKDGKMFKVFGPDDHDAILLLKHYLDVIFVSGDRKGFEISKKRIVDDMQCRLEMVSTLRRIEWIRQNMDPASTIYMGDGIFDHYVFAEVGYSICPANGFYLARARAAFVTRANAGERAVAEACVHILERFFEPFDPEVLPKQFGETGEWGV